MKECSVCGLSLEDGKLKSNKFICPKCGSYMKVSAYDRIDMVLDKESFVELFSDVSNTNPLGVDDYNQKISDTQDKTGISEAVITGIGTVKKENIAIAVCDTSFLMGSMGYVVGERITRIIEYATANLLPIFIFCASGGARMQEGIVSLMQMEKTAAALRRHDRKGLFSCTILTNPTFGGVSASFAMLGDVIMAEPGALVGFAGPRVIEQTIGRKLPAGFQSAEFQEEHGMIDGIVERKNLRRIIQFFAIASRSGDNYSHQNNDISDFDSISLFSNINTSLLEPWERVKLQRSINRKSALDYVKNIFDVFVELKGDRLYGDDQSLICGIAMLNKQPVTVIVGNRGVLPEEVLRSNYGMPFPEGYRKANRLMKQAEKFNRPIICFINTPGAYCGIEAEERGQSRAIASNLFDMSDISVPILSIITGEAGSGGALATAVGNQVWMLENATYSIISPEGYASIVWKDSSRAAEAAKNMHITAEELSRLGIIDKIIPEYNGSEDSIIKTSEYIKKEIGLFLNEMSSKTKDEIINERYDRFRKY